MTTKIRQIAMTDKITSTLTSFLQAYRQNDEVFDKESTNRRSELTIAFIVSLISAVIAITICSQSSLLYPINSWVDSNCFFTVGKAMFNGQVVYRDIYEQKGILLYFLHGLCTQISNDSFFGVYLLEIAAATAFLFFSYRIMRLYCGKLCLCTLPLLATGVYTSISFANGDSAEELCMPLLSFGLWLSLRAIRSKTTLSFGQSMMIGITSGAVLWIKYTMLGIYIGGVIVPVFLMLKSKKIKSFFTFAIGVLCGVGTITLPFFIYFAVNGALTDWFTVYFYNNIFLYTGIESSFITSINAVFGNFYYNSMFNMGFGIPIIIGIVWCILTSFSRVFEKLHILFCIGVLAFTVFFRSSAIFYYFFVFSMFAPIGLVPIVRLFEFLLDKICRSIDETVVLGKKGILALSLSLTTLFCGFCGLYSYEASPNVYLTKVSKEDMPQYRFAEIINQKEDATLLNYGWLDGGFYTAANILPNCKFFCKLNMQKLPEMDELQNEWINDAKVDFVVTYCYELVNPNYKTVASCDWVDFFGSSATYYLAEKIENERT